MDIGLINRFREKVNEFGIVKHLYHNKNGKNQWSIICSAMDWISVTAEAIDSKNLTRGNDNSSSLKLMTYIFCIDVLWESIQQLHRVFLNERDIPFDTENTVFQDKRFPSTSDNQYFKTLRACFAAHPVNLHDYFTGEEEKERRYASWSGGGIGKKDFLVYLYSNQPDIEDLDLEISFTELQQFAEHRYGYLETIMQEIDRQIDVYFTEWRKQPICKVESPLGQIDILFKASKERLNTEYYNSELEELKLVFETCISDERNLNAVTEYRAALLNVIEELYISLQEMRFDELESAKRINMVLPEDCHYAFAKLRGVAFGVGNLYLGDDNKFKKYLTGIVDFESTRTYKERYVVVKAGFYIYFRNHKSNG